MKHVEYVYTAGMDESEVEEHLREGNHGVLALATEDDAYGVPLNYHYDGDRFLIRMSEHDHAEKSRYLETTDTATFVCFEATPESSWSVLIRGPIERWSGDADEATLHQWFPPFRLFDEAVEDVEFELYELEINQVTGRRTVE